MKIELKAVSRWGEIPFSAEISDQPYEKTDVSIPLEVLLRLARDDADVKILPISRHVSVFPMVYYMNGLKPAVGDERLELEPRVPAMVEVSLLKDGETLGCDGE